MSVDIAKRIAALSPEQRALFFRKLNQKGLGIDRVEGVGRLSKTVDEIPLSFSQQRIWFLSQIAPDHPFYNEPLLAIKMTGELCFKSLNRTLAEIVRRHDILRTIYGANQGRPFQIIRPFGAIQLRLIELIDLPRQHLQTELARLAQDEAKKPFDLAEGPVYRVNLAKLGEAEHILLFEIHHIAFDGWSGGVLIQEVTSLYGAFLENQPSPLTDMPIQYADYAVWQHQESRDEVIAKHMQYWHQHLAAPLAAVRFPIDFPRPAVQRFAGRKCEVEIDSRTSDQLKGLAGQAGATLFMVLYAAFIVLLHGYTHQHDIVVGLPVAGRNRAEIEGLLGFFVNTLVLRCKWSGDPIFSDFLQQVREVVLCAYEHQEAPFEKLVEQLRPDRRSDYMPLFQVMFVLHNYPPVNHDIKGLVLEKMDVGNETSKFDMVLAMTDLRECGLLAQLNYSTELFKEATMLKALADYCEILRRVSETPGIRLSELVSTLGPKRQSQAEMLQGKEGAFMRRLNQLRTASSTEP